MAGHEVPDAPPGQDFRKNWVPVPDPTLLTTQSVDRAIGHFQDNVDIRFASLDKATRLNETTVERLAARVETERDKAAADRDRQLDALRVFFLERIDHVADVATEKITGLEAKLAERDERVKQAAAESKTSLDAAMSAASASVAQQNLANATASNKQEVAFQKLLDQQAATAKAEVQALQQQVADLKDRYSTLENRLTAAITAQSTRIESKTESKTDNRVLTTIGISVVAVVLSAVLVVFALKGG